MAKTKMIGGSPGDDYNEDFGFIFHDVHDQRVRPELALALQELHEAINANLEVTSATRKHKHYRKGSPHSHSSAMDFRLDGKANKELYMFLFGVENPLDYKMEELNLTPEADDWIKKHNLRIIDERNRDDGDAAHYHIDVMTEEGNRESHEGKASNVYEIDDDSSGAYYDKELKMKNGDGTTFSAWGWGNQPNHFVKTEFNQSDYFQNNVRSSPDDDSTWVDISDGNPVSLYNTEATPNEDEEVKTVDVGDEQIQYSVRLLIAKRDDIDESLRNKLQILQNQGYTITKKPVSEDGNMIQFSIEGDWKNYEETQKTFIDATKVFDNTFVRADKGGERISIKDAVKIERGEESNINVDEETNRVLYENPVKEFSYEIQVAVGFEESLREKYGDKLTELENQGYTYEFRTITEGKPLKELVFTGYDNYEKTREPYDAIKNEFENAFVKAKNVYGDRVSIKDAVSEERGEGAVVEKNDTDSGAPIKYLETEETEVTEEIETTETAEETENIEVEEDAETEIKTEEVEEITTETNIADENLLNIFINEGYSEEDANLLLNIANEQPDEGTRSEIINNKEIRDRELELRKAETETTEEEIIEDTETEVTEEAEVTEKIEITDKDKREGLRKEILGAYGETYLDGYFSYNSKEEALSHQKGEYSWSAGDLIMIDGKKYDAEWNYDKDRWDFIRMSDEDWNTRVEKNKTQHSENIDFQIQASIDNEEWEAIEAEEEEEERQENIGYYSKHKEQIDQILADESHPLYSKIKELEIEHEGTPIEEWPWKGIMYKNSDLEKEVESGWKYNRLEELRTQQNERVLTADELSELESLVDFETTEKDLVIAEQEKDKNELETGIREENWEREERELKESQDAEEKQLNLEKDLRLEQEEENKIVLPEDKTVESYTSYSLQKIEELNNRKNLINDVIQLEGETTENQKAELEQIDKNIATLNGLNQYLTVLKEYHPEGVDAELENHESLDSSILEGNNQKIRKEINISIKKYKQENDRLIKEAGKGIFPDDIKGDKNKEKEYIDGLRLRNEELEGLGQLDTPYFTSEELENMSVQDLFTEFFIGEDQEEVRGYMDRITNSRGEIAKWGEKWKGGIDIFLYLQGHKPGRMDDFTGEPSWITVVDNMHAKNLQEKRFQVYHEEEVDINYYGSDIKSGQGPIRHLIDWWNDEDTYWHRYEKDDANATHRADGTIKPGTVTLTTPDGKTLYITYNQWQRIKKNGPEHYYTLDENGNFVQKKIGYDIHDTKTKSLKYGDAKKIFNVQVTADDISEFKDLGIPLKNIFKIQEEDIENAVLNLSRRGTLKEEYRGTAIETLLFGGEYTEMVNGVETTKTAPGLLGAGMHTTTRGALVNLFTKLNEGQDIEISTFVNENATTYADLDLQVDEEITTEDDTELRSQGLSGQEVLQGTMNAAKGILDAFGGPDALIGAVMGKKALAAAMKDVTPEERARLSPVFHEHFRQVKELQKRGFHPSEEQKIRREIDTAYQMGLENSIRGTAGDRAKFLASSGILDAKRSSALLEFASQDAELQRQNQDKYQEMLLFKENFDATQKEQLRQENLQMQLANKKAASEFAGLTLGDTLMNMGGSSNALLQQIQQQYLGGFLAGQDQKENLGITSTFDNGNDNNDNNNNTEE